jgi:hypothetical protein
LERGKPSDLVDNWLWHLEVSNEEIESRHPSGACGTRRICRAMPTLEEEPFFLCEFADPLLRSGRVSRARISPCLQLLPLRFCWTYDRVLEGGEEIVDRRVEPGRQHPVVLPIV